MKGSSIGLLVVASVFSTILLVSWLQQLLLSSEVSDCDLNKGTACAPPPLHDGALNTAWRNAFVEPYVPPRQLYLFWGESTARGQIALDGFDGRASTGQRVRQILHFGTFTGNKYEDDATGHGHFLHSWEGAQFAAMSKKCCSTLLVPPMENDLPVYTDQDVTARRIRNFVANGNTLILLGGDYSSIVFLNNFFGYELKKVVLDDGPFEKLRPENLPANFANVAQSLPTTLEQAGASVTSIRKSSLPPGTQLLYSTPFSSPLFQIKYCQRPLAAADCRAAAAAGRPCLEAVDPAQCAACPACKGQCSCGTILYVGMAYSVQDERAWEKVLRAAADSPPIGQPGPGIFSESIPDDSYQAPPAAACADVCGAPPPAP